MVAYWYLENENYNYFIQQCDEGAICEHYLNVSIAIAMYRTIIETNCFSSPL